MAQSVFGRGTEPLRFPPPCSALSSPVRLDSLPWKFATQEGPAPVPHFNN